MNLTEKCAAIQLVLTDVDGVLTDGGVIFDNQGVESKQFHIRDGQGIRLWQQAGHRLGIVTGRSSQVVKLRAAELDIDIVRQGVKDKLQVVKAICDELQLELSQVCYLGDDLPDWSVIKHVGLGVAVGDAAEEAETRRRLHNQRQRRPRRDARSRRIAAEEHESMGIGVEEVSVT